MIEIAKLLASRPYYISKKQRGLNHDTSRGDKPVKTLIERGFQPWRSLYKLSKTRGLIENKQ